MKRIVLATLILAVYLPLVHVAHAQHVTSGIIAEYDFEEGSGDQVLDVSGFGAALDLTILDTGNVTWGAGYLSVDTSTVLDSLGPATKINDAVALGGAPSHEISIEAFVKPANDTQGGAARLVNIGVKSTLARNRVCETVDVETDLAKPDGFPVYQVGTLPQLQFSVFFGIVSHRLENCVSRSPKQVLIVFLSGLFLRAGGVFGLPQAGAQQGL